jgi:hypothetical protein
LRKKFQYIPGNGRDERKAQAMGLPITCNDIINLPMDEFNDLLSKHELTEEQLTLCRDIRRRGKNKVTEKKILHKKILNKNHSPHFFTYQICVAITRSWCESYMSGLWR